MKTFRIGLMICSIAALRGVTAQPAEPPTHAPASIELNDQYEAPQRLAFPTTNVVVLTIADQAGSKQIDAWIAAIKGRYGAEVDLRGLAHVGDVPAFLRGRVRKKFRETRKFPVMMDWSGDVCPQFRSESGVANVLVIGRDGAIRAHLTGAAHSPALERAFSCIDAALLNLKSDQTNATLELPASQNP